MVLTPQRSDVKLEFDQNINITTYNSTAENSGNDAILDEAEVITPISMKTRVAALEEEREIETLESNGMVTKPVAQLLMGHDSFALGYDSSEFASAEDNDNDNENENNNETETNRNGTMLIIAPPKSNTTKPNDSNKESENESEKAKKQKKTKERKKDSNIKKKGLTSGLIIGNGVNKDMMAFSSARKMKRSKQKSPKIPKTGAPPRSGVPIAATRVGLSGLSKEITKDSNLQSYVLIACA